MKKLASLLTNLGQRRSVTFQIRHAIIGRHQCVKVQVYFVVLHYRPEVESRTQGSRPARPRTQKKIRGQGQGQPFRGQTLSRSRTGMLGAKDTSASALQKKKRSSQKFFKPSPQKNVFQKNFQALHKILTIQKILLSSSRGQANFRGLEASRPRPRT